MQRCGCTEVVGVGLVRWSDEVEVQGGKNTTWFQVWGGLGDDEQ